MHPTTSRFFRDLLREDAGPAEARRFLEALGNRMESVQTEPPGVEHSAEVINLSPWEYHFTRASLERKAVAHGGY